MKTEPKEQDHERSESVGPFPDGPPVLFVEDLVAVLRITAGAVRKMIIRGELGPHLRIGRRLALRRGTFFEALAAREVRPDTAPSHVQSPTVKP